MKLLHGGMVPPHMRARLNDYWAPETKLLARMLARDGSSARDIAARMLDFGARVSHETIRGWVRPQRPKRPRRWTQMGLFA